MKTLNERVAVLEEKADSQEDVNKELLDAVRELNKVLHQNKGALKLIGWIFALASALSGFIWWKH